MEFFEKSNFRKGRFVPFPDQNLKGFWDVMRWRWSCHPKPWPLWRESTSLPQPLKVAHQQAVNATWINHSTTLLQIHGVTILTDPVFSNYVGPFRWLGIKRVTPPSHEIKSLPRIDVILISHNHYDHLDAGSLKQLISLYNPLIVAPLGNEPLLRSLGAQKVVELDWWETHHLNDSLHIHLTPALHWSRRSLWDTCRSLWGGFVIESLRLKVFFAGDTGYHSHFQMIYQRFGAMDLSLLPIGAYEPRWLMKEAHMNPSEAVQAHLDLQSKQSMGIHFGTFRLTDEGIDDPIHELKKALTEKSINPTLFIAPWIGQTIVASNSLHSI